MSECNNIYCVGHCTFCIEQERNDLRSQLAAAIKAKEAVEIELSKLQEKYRACVDIAAREHLQANAIREILPTLVDICYQEFTEQSGSVPSTDWAEQLIKQAINNKEKL